ncbi:hypothetical protein ANAPC5_01441 [Anaplasma phagocytophilum]|nr:hypothetical protein ANAPC5_01441 [Anaplasma phagocytophilum]
MKDLAPWKLVQEDGMNKKYSQLLNSCTWNKLASEGKIETREDVGTLYTCPKSMTDVALKRAVFFVALPATSNEATTLKRVHRGCDEPAGCP